MEFLSNGGQTDLIAEGYTDGCFMTNPDNRRSQSGYVFLLNSGVVSWNSWKQSTMVNSTTLAEDQSAETRKEVVWIKKFLEEL